MRRGPKAAKATKAALLLPLLGAPALSGCVVDVPSGESLTSLRLILKEPTESGLGREGAPVQIKDLLFDLQTVGPDRRPVPRDMQVRAFLAAGGQRLSLRNPCGGGSGTGGADMGAGGADQPPLWELASIPLRGGQATGVRVSLDAPAIFGQVALTVEDPITGASGATPPIFLPNPTLPRLMTPLDLDARDATYCTPYLGRQVVLDTATGNGKLVVSSVFQNAFAVSDSGAKEYNSIYVFTFSRPSSRIVPGRVLTRLGGAVAKFNGFTQIANPNILYGEEVNPSLVPRPVELTAAMRPRTPVNSNEHKALTKLIAAPVVARAKICDVTDSYRKDAWDRYNTIVLSYDATDKCDNRNTFSVQLPGKGFACLDPLRHAGQEFSVTGMLQNSATRSGTTLFWTIIVRETADISPPPSC
jgi:hypothetical protein